MIQYFAKPFGGDKKLNLASLKTKVFELNFDKLVPVPDDLNNLSDVVENYVQKAACDKLVEKVKVLILENLFQKLGVTYTKQLENEIPYTSRLVKKTDYDANITEIEGKILSNQVLVGYLQILH